VSKTSPRYVLAIDPGYLRSAWVFYDAHGRLIRGYGIVENEQFLRLCGSVVQRAWPLVDKIVIEKVEGYGMPVGAEVFETVYWTGRFHEALVRAGYGEPERMPRRRVKLHLCNSPRGNDAAIRQALIDRFGPGQDKAIGRKATPGPLYGITKDVWAALAVAVTYAEAGN
jgi:hypothetical protein